MMTMACLPRSPTRASGGLSPPRPNRHARVPAWTARLSASSTAQEPP